MCTARFLKAVGRLYSSDDDSPDWSDASSPVFLSSTTFWEADVLNCKNITFILDSFKKKANIFNSENFIIIIKQTWMLSNQQTNQLIDVYYQNYVRVATKLLFIWR